MKKTIIHVGLAKTGTTSFQRHVLKTICKEKKINHYNESKELQNFLSEHKTRLRFDKEIEKSPNLVNFFISMESLSNPRNPFFWKKCADKNYEAFGKDNHILIVLRNPKEYLKSIYLEVCIHEGYYKKINEFFLKKNDYNQNNSLYKFSIEDFDYKKLISYYTNNFKKVTYVKFEKFENFDFLNDMFKDISQVDKNNYKKLFNSYKTNISYNNFNVKLTIIIYYISKFIFIIFNNFLFRNILNYIAKIYINKLNKSDTIKIQAIEKINNDNINFEQIFHHLLRIIRWDKIINFLMKYTPKKKYELIIKDEEIKKIIDKFNLEYEKLEDYKTFIKD